MIKNVGGRRLAPVEINGRETTPPYINAHSCVGICEDCGICAGPQEIPLVKVGSTSEVEAVVRRVVTISEALYLHNPFTPKRPPPSLLKTTSTLLVYPPPLHSS